MFLNLKRKEGILSFKVPLPYVIGAICVSMIGMQLYITRFSDRNDSNISSSQIEPCPSSIVMTRRHTLGLTQPLLLSDNYNESESLNPLKASINSYIDQKKGQGELIDCSVYYRKFNTGEFMTIDNGVYFKPGSLAKLTILISLLKQSETDKNLLSKKIVVDNRTDVVVTQSFKNEELVNGKQYSVKELLEFMIKNSSNTATAILSSEIDQTTFKNLFTDLNLKSPELTNIEYTINAEGISKFMQLLYNVTYLNEKNSEYAMKLLSESHFNDGMLKSIPKNVVIAHKYGEQGDANSKQLHETAIIYANNTPYLLTIMCKGKTMEPLPKIIEEITLLTYNSSASVSN